MLTEGNGVATDVIYQYRNHSQQQLKYRYYIFLVSGQVNPIFDNCQIISVHRHIKAVYHSSLTAIYTEQSIPDNRHLYASHSYLV